MTQVQLVMTVTVIKIFLEKTLLSNLNQTCAQNVKAMEVADHHHIQVEHDLIFLIMKTCHNRTLFMMSAQIL